MVGPIGEQLNGEIAKLIGLPNVRQGALGCHDIEGGQPPIWVFSDCEHDRCALAVPSYIGDGDLRTALMTSIVEEGWTFALTAISPNSKAGSEGLKFHAQFSRRVGDCVDVRGGDDERVEYAIVRAAIEVRKTEKVVLEEPLQAVIQPIK